MLYISDRSKPVISFSSTMRGYLSLPQSTKLTKRALLYTRVFTKHAPISTQLAMCIRFTVELGLPLGNQLKCLTKVGTVDSPILCALLLIQSFEAVERESENASSDTSFQTLACSIMILRYMKASAELSLPHKRGKTLPMLWGLLSVTSFFKTTGT